MNDDARFDLWSRRYDRSLAQSAFFGPVQRALVSAVSSLVEPKSVLDIGCGTGRLLEQLGSAAAGVLCFGVDRSSGMLMAARRIRPELSLSRAAAEALPFSDEAFDLVTTTVSFHHWSDRATSLSEVRRVLRPGGVFALADPAPDDIPGWQGPLRKWLHRDRHMVPLAERNALVETAGLEIIETRRALLGHWVPLTLARRGP